MTNEEMLRRLREIRSDYDDDIKKYGMLKGYLDDAEALDKAISIIEELPSADPERPNGEWITVLENHTYQCSQCGQRIITNRDYIKEHKFCFRCGAKLRARIDEID